MPRGEARLGSRVSTARLRHVRQPGGPRATAVRSMSQSVFSHYPEALEAAPGHRLPLQHGLRGRRLLFVLGKGRGCGRGSVPLPGDSVSGPRPPDRNTAAGACLGYFQNSYIWVVKRFLKKCCSASVLDV